MAELKHTPEPWVITERKGNACFGEHAIECLIHAGDGNAFAIVSLGASGAISSRPEDVRANAHLIAAAPNMLTALKKLRRGDFPENEQPLWDEIQAAIAKAAGGF